MAQELVRLDQRSEAIASLFKINKGHIIAAAPKTSGDPLRLFNIAFNAIAYDPKLLECTEVSLIGGVFEAIKLGIAIGGPMQEGWLIPYSRKATLIVGYQGYRNIIDRAGGVIDLHPRAVHNGKQKKGNEWVQGKEDQFDYYYGDSPRIIHRPLNAMPQYREQLRAVYAVANLRKGGKQLEVLEIDEIEAHRARSRAKDNGPWVTDYVPMALKTAIRKISKYLPKSNELLARAMELDDRADRGVDQDFEIPEKVEIPGENAKNVTPASPMDRLKQEVGATPKPPAAQGAPPAAEDIDWGGGSR